MYEVFNKFRKVREKNYPYIIAEVGVNHECSMQKAKKMIKLAAAAGANAVKFQTYKADLLASKNSPYYWNLNSEKSRNQHQLFKKFDKFEKENYIELKKYCTKKKVEFMSTPFDSKAVNFLNPLLNVYKIASADINNLPLLEQIASKKKPIILSTGASSLKEIKEATKVLKKNGCPNISLMHCILNYPTQNKNANLNMIKDLQEHFPNFTIGYSDHTVPDKNMITLLNAYLKGAKIIEKHFTYNKNLKGNDHYHSMDHEDLKIFFKNLDLIFETSGLKKKKFLKSEKKSRKNARRSIVLYRNVEKGEILNQTSIITKRPGTGINPMFWHKVLGKIVKKKLLKDHLLSWKDFK